MAPLFGEFRLKPLEAVSQRPGGESALRYWQGGSRAPATATGSQCTLPGGVGQVGGPRSRTGFGREFGAPQGLQAIPPARGGCAQGLLLGHGVTATSPLVLESSLEQGGAVWQP